MKKNQSNLSTEIEQFELKGGKLPLDLKEAIDQIEDEAIGYPQRSRAIHSLREYIANGNFDLAMYEANNVIERQQNLQSSVPQDLRLLLEKIEIEAVDYLQRSRAINTLHEYISNGNFDLAIYEAKNIIERQQNLQSEVPQDLRLLLEKIETEAVDYPQRSRAINTLQEYISNGNFDLAVYEAKNIIERQQNLHSGVPQDLRLLLEKIETEAVDYPQRSRAISTLGEYISNGNFDLAIYEAKNIIERQQNLHRGVPQDLRLLFEKIETEAVDYPQRSRAISTLQEYITNGNYDLAAYEAKNIIERQQNLNESKENLG